MIKITFLGDIMFDNQTAKTLDLYSDENTKKYSFESIFSHMTTFFNKSDYVIGNLETPLTENKEKLTNKQWEFCTALEFGEAAKKSGISCVSTANNHCLDRGIEGICDTISCLEKIGIANCGIYLPDKKHKELIVQIGTMRFGIISYTYGTNAFSNGQYLGIKYRKCVNLLQEQEEAVNNHDFWLRYSKKNPTSIIAKLRHRFDRCIFAENQGKEIFEKITYNKYRLFRLKKEIRRIQKQKVDYIIACVHIGGQYNLKPSKYTERTTKWLLKKHCNIVIANHEHVIHNSYTNIGKNQFISYALGNFFGSAGTLEQPYDRLSEYSVAAHLYFDENTKDITKTSFSILKTVKTEDGKMEVWPVFDLIKSLKPEQAELEKKNCIKAAFLFSQKEYSDVQEEFVLEEK